jgi:hypothetical protein
MKQVVTNGRREDGPGIEQDLGTSQAREVLLAERVATVAERTGSHPEQSAVVLIRPPRQQRRVVRQQPPETFDVIVVDDAAGFGDGPCECAAEASLYFFDQVLPAGEPIFARQHQLGITL